jgi:hypothetical protein
VELPIIAALIGVGGALTGALLGVFKEEIKNAFQFAKSRRNVFLLGPWDCTWDTTAPTKRAEIRDRVDITSVRGNLVKGNGSTPGYGTWSMDGRVSHLALSASYSGKATNQNLPGSLVLKIVNNDEMSGAWAQYSKTGDVLSGTTVWRRATS